MATGVMVPPEVRKKISLTKRECAIRGEKHLNAILTEKDVKDIVFKRTELLKSEYSIAEEYGVSRSTVSAILRGWTWGHVTGLGDGRIQRRKYKPKSHGGDRT